jgi:hypothetical protein
MPVPAAQQPLRVQAQHILLDIFLVSIGVPRILPDERETALLQYTQRRGIRLGTSAVQRALRHRFEKESQRTRGDACAPEGSADPIGNLETFQVRRLVGRHVTSHGIIGEHCPRDDRLIRQDAGPSVVEGGPIMRIFDRERRHPVGFLIALIIEEELEVAFVDVPQRHLYLRCHIPSPLLVPHLRARRPPQRSADSEAVGRRVPAAPSPITDCRISAYLAEVMLRATEDALQRECPAMPKTWLAITVELVSGRGELFWPRPGRVLFAGRSMSFRELARAIDVTFGRWDFGHLHHFVLVDGAEVVPIEWWDEASGAELDDDRTLLARLKGGEQFAYSRRCWPTSR